MAERQPDRITVTLGFTRNLGNFESMRADISLGSDRLDNESTIDDTMQRVYDYVEKRFLERFNHTEVEVNKILEAEKKAKGKK